MCTSSTIPFASSIDSAVRLTTSFAIIGQASIKPVMYLKTTLAWRLSAAMIATVPRSPGARMRE